MCSGSDFRHRRETSDTTEFLLLVPWTHSWAWLCVSLDALLAVWLCVSLSVLLVVWLCFGLCCHTIFLDDTCQLGVFLPGTGCLSWFLTPVGMDVFLALLAVPHPVYGTRKEQLPMRFSNWSSPGMFRGSCRWYLSLSLPRAGVTEVCP